MEFGLHPRNVKATVSRKSLDIAQDLFWPNQFIIVGDNNHSIPIALDGLHPSLDKHIYTFALVRCTPWRICIKAIVLVHVGKSLEAIIEFCVEMLDSFSVSKPSYCLHCSLIEVENSDLRWTEIKYVAGAHISDAHAYRVTVANEGEPLAISPVGDNFGLQDHVAYLHMYLIEFPKRLRTILYNVGYGVDCFSKINMITHISALLKCRSDHKSRLASRSTKSSWSTVESKK